MIYISFERWGKDESGPRAFGVFENDEDAVRAVEAHRREPGDDYYYMVHDVDENGRIKGWGNDFMTYEGEDNEPR